MFTFERHFLCKVLPFWIIFKNFSKSERTPVSHNYVDRLQLLLLFRAVHYIVQDGIFQRRLKTTKTLGLSFIKKRMSSVGQVSINAAPEYLNHSLTIMSKCRYSKSNALINDDHEEWYHETELIQYLKSGP